MVFRFSLQRVLDFRLQLEDQAKNELARAIKALEDHRQLMARLAGMQRTSFAEMVARQREGVWADEFRDMIDFLRSVDRRLKEGAIEEVGLRQEVERRRERYFAVRQEREIMDALRRRHLAAWQIELRRLEGKELDEAAILRHRRKNEILATE
ncbi:MAG: flagellar export protein FliJ [Proteobacteria bacterium]|nr:flagellar export protein FliJ [Pseudomonadota bacterium]MBU1743197.1 flagellar export protein FliJ [Pseudomonadota bacterium]